MAEIKHVFVLALENRSFDHIFGFAALEGVEAVTGQPTKAEDLIGKPQENVSSDGRHRFVTGPDATFTIPVGKDETGDPGHEFLNVIRQICGPDKVPQGKLPNGEYPPINMSGFVADYEIAEPQHSPQIVMNCQDSNNLPVLNQLAREFMVCDHWFASHPGPTWPNRFFIHAASATGQADSPSGWNIFNAWDGVDKYTFHRGTIYDALARKRHTHQIYIENSLSQVVCIGNQTVDMNVKHLESFEKDISDPNFPHSYVFIEPNSGEEQNIGPAIKIGGGTEDDMHPPSDIRNAEALVKRVYEGLRNSPLWDQSVLVVTFDEHGGFFDHVPPPKVRPLDDGSVDNTHGFRYDQLGVRVPALIISPWVKRNSIDHTVYEHSSIIASVVRLFELDHLTSRDRNAADFLARLSEKAPRTDAPARLHTVWDGSNVTHVDIPEILAPGQTGEVTITYANIGVTTWSKNQGYKLVDIQPAVTQQQETETGMHFPWVPSGQGGQRQPGGGRHDATITPASVDLAHDVAPGQSVTFKTWIKAPETAGCLVFQWGMAREGVHEFGQRTSPVAVIFGTSQSQLDEAWLSFFQIAPGPDADTLIEASLHDESKGLIASLKLSGHPFAAHSVTNWFQMSPGTNLGRFAECQPRFLSVRMTPKGHDVWSSATHLLLNWTGGCSMFVWGLILTDQPNERQRDVFLATPSTRIAFKVPGAKGANVQGVIKLEVDAKLGNQLDGIEFAIDYVNVNGKHASFTLGAGERVADDTFLLTWDLSKKLPPDRDRTALDVTLIASAVAAPGSKLWQGRDTPRALLPVHLEVPI